MQILRQNLVLIVPIERCDDGHIRRIVVVRDEQKRGNIYYKFPGGRVNRGEAVREAARRELLEETGLNLGEATQVRCLGSLRQSRPGGASYQVTLFVAEFPRHLIRRVRDESDTLTAHVVRPRDIRGEDAFLEQHELWLLDKDRCLHAALFVD